MDFSMIYPTFVISEDRGFIPRIYLPKDYKTLLPRFYKQKRNEEVIIYTQQVQKVNPTGTKILTKWDDEKGLVNISIGTTGLDLYDRGWPHFQEHNLGGINSFITSSIAMKYISELLKSNK